MSNFQKDVQLLTDLQELISDAERTANMPGYAGAVFNAISPALKAAMPAAQKKARRQNRCADPRQRTADGADGGTAEMTNGDFIRSMSDADIRENFTQLLCEFVQRKQTSRCRSREHCFHCIKDWLKEESVALRRADDDTE